MSAKNMDEIVALCKRRGFVFAGSDIYGGVSGTYDWGPLGVELKSNLKRSWWRSMVYDRDDVEGLDASIIGNRLVYQHSGHEDTFHDPIVDCKDCKRRMRQDKMKDPGRCDFCGSANLTEARPFSQMMKVGIGVIDGEHAYLRPETAQGTFINFKNVLDATSRKLPFGIAQIGKSFRNEIAPRNFVFREVEFEQMELEFFVRPGEDEKWHEHWVAARRDWWIRQGISPENLELEVHKKEELSHYSKATTDILYRYPWGFDELEGIANRTDFDLGSHSKDQGSLGIAARVKENQDSLSKLAYADPADGKTFVPFVIEPAAGVDRGILALLCEAYDEEDLDGGDKRVVLHLAPHIAPVKAAVVPLAKNNPQIVAKAIEVQNILKLSGIGKIALEMSGNVGKSYRRHDEIGTPICITIDFETLEKQPETITIRHRDTMGQIRLPISGLMNYANNFFKAV
ncbi:MAG: glycine--tRNA ligase [Rickettsiales bacterium]|jgi:glycyl-tRNA synthetase|nr:glycine--tRNA ligase [Rickettsiales bacterium]